MKNIPKMKSSKPKIDLRERLIKKIFISGNIPKFSNTPPQGPSEDFKKEQSERWKRIQKGIDMNQLRVYVNR